MGREERHYLIREIEKERNSRVLVLITGDRRGLETKIASDVFPFCLNHLTQMGHQENIDLYLYSTGGITMAGYALVNLISEYCNHLRVIVPFKAHSCATLIALGAESIVMTKMGQLSPVDPSVISPLAPQVQAPGMPPQVIPVNVEDVINYFELARKELSIEDEEMLTRIFERVSQNVHPLTLGSVYRAREQISFLAKSLLSRHLDDEEKIKKIVDIVTKGRFSHDYIIGYQEAKETLELPIERINNSLQDNIVQLWMEYDNLLKINVPYYPEVVLGSEDVVQATFNRAIVESDNLTHVFRTIREVKRVEIPAAEGRPPQVGHLERPLSESWILDDTI